MQRNSGELEADRPLILGALLDGLSGMMRLLPEVHLEKRPRMADAARAGEAACRAHGWAPGTFISLYEEQPPRHDGRRPGEFRRGPRDHQAHGRPAHVVDRDVVGAARRADDDGGRQGRGGQVVAQVGPLALDGPAPH